MYSALHLAIKNYFALDRGVDLLVLTQDEINQRLAGNDRWLG